MQLTHAVHVGGGGGREGSKHEKKIEDCFWFIVCSSAMGLGRLTITIFEYSVILFYLILSYRICLYCVMSQLWVWNTDSRETVNNQGSDYHAKLSNSHRLCKFQKNLIPVFATQLYPDLSPTIFDVKSIPLP